VDEHPTLPRRPGFSPTPTLKRHLPAVVLLLLGLSPAMAEPVSGDADPWRPPAEPAPWARVRQDLTLLGPPAGLAAREWVYMRSLDRADLQVVEYLAGIRAGRQGEEKTAEFNAVVLVRRGGPRGEWVVRERPMRVVCGTGALEAADSQGQWQPYEGHRDAESSRRRGWICGQAGIHPHSAQPPSPAPLRPETFQWFGLPGNPKLRAAWVIGSESARSAYLLRVMLARGGKIPAHLHPDERHTTVLAGTLYVGFGEVADESKIVAIPTGGVYVAPANVPHYLWAKDGDVIYQESGTGPTATRFLDRKATQGAHGGSARQRPSPPPIRSGN
jgi:quercetin dioxygenase-like cupin family protein